MSEKWVEIIRFIIVGGTTFCLDYGVLYVLTEYVGISYFYSSAIAFCMAVIVNYVLCLMFVFKGAQNGWKQVMLFLLSSIIGLFLNQFCMFFLVEILTLHYMLAKIGSTIVVTIWNYVTKKKSLEF